MTKRCKVGEQLPNQVRTRSQNPASARNQSKKVLNQTRVRENIQYESTPQQFENNLHDLENCYADSKSKQYLCDHCSKDISTQAKIRCAICDELHLCLGCFSVGAETKSHKYWHDYRIVEYLHVPLFCRQWGADEEILLLEGLEMYGMGNWSDISSHVSTKDSAECKEHYFKYYLNATVPIENLFDGVVVDKVNIEYLNSTQFQKSHSPVVSSPSHKKEITKVHPEYQSKDYLCGYLPVRDEFEVEWDMSCEEDIAQLQFDSEDSAEEIEMKLSLLQLYNERLEKRRQIKKFVVDHKLHNLNFQTKARQLRTKKHREIYNKMKKFLQIMSNEELEEIVNDFVEETELEERIQELQGYRSAGLTTFKDAKLHKQNQKNLRSPQVVSDDTDLKSPDSRASSRLHEKQQKQRQQEKVLKQHRKQQQQEQRVQRQQQRQQQQDALKTVEQQSPFNFNLSDYQPLSSSDDFALEQLFSHQIFDYHQKSFNAQDSTSQQQPQPQQQSQSQPQQQPLPPSQSHVFVEQASPKPERKHSVIIAPTVVEESKAEVIYVQDQDLRTSSRLRQKKQQQQDQVKRKQQRQVQRDQLRRQKHQEQEPEELQLQEQELMRMQREFDQQREIIALREQCEDDEEIIIEINEDEFNVLDDDDDGYFESFEELLEVEPDQIFELQMIEPLEQIDIEWEQQKVKYSPNTQQQMQLIRSSKKIKNERMKQTAFAPKPKQLRRPLVRQAPRQQPHEQMKQRQQQRQRLRQHHGSREQQLIPQEKSHTSSSHSQRDAFIPYFCLELSEYQAVSLTY